MSTRHHYIRTRIMLRVHYKIQHFEEAERKADPNFEGSDFLQIFRVASEWVDVILCRRLFLKEMSTTSTPHYLHWNYTMYYASYQKKGMLLVHENNTKQPMESRSNFLLSETR